MAFRSKLGLIVLAAALAGGVAGGALAQDMPGQGQGGPMNRPAFADLDTDGDGAVSVDEAKAYRAAQFAAKDTDGNGTLSRDEMVAAMTAPAQARAAKMVDTMLIWRDSDGDGALSLAEMPGDATMQMFQRLDADGDGLVTAEEFAAARSHMMENRRGFGDGRGGHDRGHGFGWRGGN